MELHELLQNEAPTGCKAVKIIFTKEGYDLEYQMSSFEDLSWAYLGSIHKKSLDNIR